jgi:hypothetical protein
MTIKLSSYSKSWGNVVRKDNKAAGDKFKNVLKVNKQDVKKWFSGK